MGPYRFVGYAIVSADGMLATASNAMPQSLKIPGDQRFFEAGLDATDLIVHGRNSYEDQPRSPLRKRVFATRSVTAPVPDPDNPNAVLWNPAYATIEEAARLAGVASGTVAAIGGTSIFDMFLDRYDTFFLSQAPRVKLPGGIPVFSGIPPRTPEEILAAHGLKPAVRRVIDAAHDATVTEWTRA
jgi:dihydrofolate reductase